MCVDISHLVLEALGDTDDQVVDEDQQLSIPVSYVDHDSDDLSPDGFARR